MIQHSPLSFEWTGINLFFRFAIIAALPEPAYGPTHGLLSRRSTDRISTSPLANFAQLSMFRFDGLIKNHSCFIVNNNSCIND